MLKFITFLSILIIYLIFLFLYLSLSLILLLLIKMGTLFHFFHSILLLFHFLKFLFIKFNLDGLIKSLWLCILYEDLGFLVIFSKVDVQISVSLQ